MKDLVQTIIAYLPWYLTEFGSVFSSPKRFTALKNSNTDESFAQSLLFLAISYALFVVMFAPLLRPDMDFWLFVTAIGVGGLLTVSLGGLALQASWWIVGGRAPFRSFFVTYAYYSGVSTVAIALVFLLSEGFYKTFDPELHAKVRQAGAFSKLAEVGVEPGTLFQVIPLVSSAILFVGVVLLFTWVFIGWGAFRQLNKVGRGRSFFAFLIFGIFAWPIPIVIYFIQAAILS